MRVELENTREQREKFHGTSSPEKDKPHATRISPSNIEVVYPLLDNLLLYPNEENHYPLISIPTNNRKKDFQTVQNSFQGTSLHVAHMLGLVFSRHQDPVRADDLKQYFPTYPGNGLEIMAYFANRATARASGVERLFHIYEQYHEVQRELIKEGVHITTKDAQLAWDNKNTRTKVRDYLGELYYLHETNQLLVSDPRVIMQFEVSLIPLFKDLMLQSPMSIDMMVKVPHHPVQIYDLKKDHVPNIRTEESLHQRYLMNAATRAYVKHLEGTPSYFGSSVIQSYIHAVPDEYEPFDFFYTTNKFDLHSGKFEEINATIPNNDLWTVYEGLRTRAQMINDNKPIVRRYLSLHEHLAPLPNMPSLFRIQPKDEDTEEEALTSLV